MLKTGLFAVILTATMLFTGCSDSSEGSGDIVATTDYSLVDTHNTPFTVRKEGSRFSVAGHEDKIILFDIFATWCPPCRATAPHLTSLQKKFEGELLVMGVTIEDDKSHADLEAFKAENGAEYTIVNSSDNHKLTSDIAQAIRVGQRHPIPLMVLYKDGKYITHYVGATPEEMIESDIRQALGE